MAEHNIDKDPTETQEWLDALESVLDTGGPERAHFLLQEMIKKAQRLIQEFNFYNTEDEALPVDERFGTSIMLAMRPWEIKLFGDLRREEDTKVF